MYTVNTGHIPKINLSIPFYSLVTHHAHTPFRNRDASELFFLLETAIY